MVLPGSSSTTILRPRTSAWQLSDLSPMQLKELFKDELPDSEKVLVDVKSLYRHDKLVASGMKFWRL